MTTCRTADSWYISFSYEQEGQPTIKKHNDVGVELIDNCGFYEFNHQLEYKARKFGSEIIIADRFYPSSKICSHCEHKKEHLSLSQRAYSRFQVNEVRVEIQNMAYATLRYQT